MSLLKAKAAGADIRMVYSTLDALRIAQDEPARNVVFFAHRFRDHDAADRAWRFCTRKRRGLTNFFVFCNHVLTPAAIQTIVGEPDGERNGAARRLCRPGPCLDGDRHKALRVFRGRITQSRWSSPGSNRST